MKLLVLGGTTFVGRATVAAALARDHEVTLFNRGQTNPELFPEAEKLRGDRAKDLSILAGRSFDAVVDPSGYVPSVVRASAELLAEAVGYYLFVSSISVYADRSGPATEESGTAELNDMPAEKLLEDYSNYGALKALSEQAVRESFPGSHAVVRPGLIVGPHDPTGRFTYWPHRVARGAEVLAPGPPERTVQIVDVRDLGEWMVMLCEQRRGGMFNAVRPGVSWGELLETSRDVAGNEAEPVWVTDEFLLEHEVGQWMELPLWLQDPELVGMHMADASRAIEAGLTFRPLAETIRGALEHAEPTDDAGLTPEREAELLAAWHAR